MCDFDDFGWMNSVFGYGNLDINPTSQDVPLSLNETSVDTSFLDFTVPGSPDLPSKAAVEDIKQDIKKDIKKGALALLPETLTVEELREELRLRHLSSGGNKPLLLSRLWKFLGSKTFERLSTAGVKRKRPHTRKEPQPDEFDNKAEYEDAWEKWREVRNSNNDAVKRSRALRRKQRVAQLRACSATEEENHKLEEHLWGLRREAEFLVNAITDPTSLDKDAQQKLYEEVQKYKGYDIPKSLDVMPNSSTFNNQTK